jgi:tetratricopeptide (TPR) repeat protein
VGKDLGVRFVLQGSVQRSGNKLRINAQLGDTATDSQLWSDSFDGLETDLFSLQDLITRRIGNSIRREMVIAAARDSERRTTSEGVADLLLRASALWIKPPWSLETLQKIEGLYRQALSAEPNNASVMVRLAFALTFQATDHRAELTAVDREGKLEEAYRLATSAQSIDPGNPDASSILGVYAYEHDDFEGYRRGAEAAASLSPMRQDYQEALANMLVAAGEPKRAIETLTKLMEAQSRHHSDWVYEDLGQAYFMLGDDSTALLHFQKAVEQNPAEPAYRADLAMAYADSGDTSKAHTELTEMLRIDPHFVFSKPIPSAPAPAHEYWEKRFLPAAKKAGVPVE